MRGNKVGARIQRQVNSSQRQITNSQGQLLAVNDLILHALLVRIALNNDESAEFQTKYDPATNTVDLDIPDGYIPFLDEITGMQRGPNLQAFINWLIGSGTLAPATKTDQGFIASGSLNPWFGATQTVVDEVPLLTLPADSMAVVGFNTRASGTFSGGLRVFLTWMYIGGGTNGFEVSTNVQINSVTGDMPLSSTSEVTDVSTLNLVTGDIREKLIIDTGTVVNTNDLISILIRRNFPGNADPQTDLVGAVGLRLEFYNG